MHMGDVTTTGGIRERIYISIGLSMIIRNVLVAHQRELFESSRYSPEQYEVKSVVKITNLMSIQRCNDENGEKMKVNTRTLEH